MTSERTWPSATLPVKLPASWAAATRARPDRRRLRAAVGARLRHQRLRRRPGITAGGGAAGGVGVLSDRAGAAGRPGGGRRRAGAPRPRGLGRVFPALAGRWPLLALPPPPR